MHTQPRGSRDGSGLAAPQKASPYPQKVSPCPRRASPHPQKGLPVSLKGPPIPLTFQVAAGGRREPLLRLAAHQFQANLQHFHLLEFGLSCAVSFLPFSSSSLKVTQQKCSPHHLKGRTREAQSPRGPAAPRPGQDCSHPPARPLQQEGTALGAERCQQRAPFSLRASAPRRPPDGLLTAGSKLRPRSLTLLLPAGEVCTFGICIFHTSMYSR